MATPGIRFIRRFGRVIPIRSAVEVAGLGLIAAPTVKKILGKKVSPGDEKLSEVAGLGLLAASAIAPAAPKVKRLFQAFSRLRRMRGR